MTLNDPKLHPIIHTRYNHTTWASDADYIQAQKIKSFSHIEDELNYCKTSTNLIDKILISATRDFIIVSFSESITEDILLKLSKHIWNKYNLSTEICSYNRELLILF
jgi:hypothetical protein